MKHHNLSEQYANSLKGYYGDLSRRVKSGDDLCEMELFLEELRDLIAENSEQPELRLVANGGWA